MRQQPNRYAHFATAAVLLGSVTWRIAAASGSDWAFLGCPASAPAPDLQRVERLEGSAQRYSRARILQRADAIDWFPQRHGAMPAVVASARGPGKTACAYCHLPDGAGRPENAKIAGLPAAYIVSQLAQMHGGERGSAEAGYPPLVLMRASIEGLSDDDIRSAADYFARQRPRSFERVIETDRVPAHVARCFVLVPATGAAEPLGDQIVELAGQLDRFEKRDPRTTYTAYVPRGSLQRGAKLVAQGRDTLPACASCHGADLRGGNELVGPPIAGRFAGYLARQLYGFKSAARHGQSAVSMQAVAAQLSERDLMDVAAYAASLKP